MSNAVKEIYKKNKNIDFWEILLSGGEDYELLFAISDEKRINISERNDFTKIGYFSNGTGLRIIDRNGNHFYPNKIGFSHF